MKFLYLIFLASLFSCAIKDFSINFNDTIKVSLFPPIDEIEYNNDGSIKLLDEFPAKISQVNSSKGKFSIIIVDRNNNNNFNDLGIDLIRIEKFGIKKTNEIFFSKIKKYNQFEINHQAFIIRNVSKKGQTAILEWGIKDTLISNHRMIDKLPNIAFKIAGADSLNFQRLLKESNTYVYLNFWGSWCSICIDKIPDLKKLHDKYQDRLIIVGLNWKDSEDVIEKYKDRFNMNWIQGIASEQINKAFLVEAYPYSMLFDHNGNILETNVDHQILENEYLLKDF